jgi:hypothetical protein
VACHSIHVGINVMLAPEGNITAAVACIARAVPILEAERTLLLTAHRVRGRVADDVRTELAALDAVIVDMRKVLQA